MHNYIAPDLLARLAQEREIMIAVILAEGAACGAGGTRSQIEKECVRLAGLPLAAIRRLAPEELMALLQRTGNEAARAALLVELLLMDGELYEQEANLPLATISQLQSLALITDVFGSLGEDEQARYRSRLDSMAQRLTKLSREPYLHSVVTHYMQVTGQTKPQ